MSGDTLRFSTELEFVQALANPFYLNFLAQQRFLERPDFIRYLHYLRYWKEPRYARFISFPQSLSFLDLLCSSALFRKELKNLQFANELHTQQLFHWMNHRPAADADKGEEAQTVADESQGRGAVPSRCFGDRPT